jgi:hypothetical protein
MGFEAFINGIAFPITADIKGLVEGLGQVDAKLTAQEQAFDRGTKVIQDWGLKAGIALTGVGIGITGLSESALKTNAGLGSTAITMRVTTEELRNLAIATASADTPLSEVTATFDLLSRAGIKSTSDLSLVTGGMDALADATGNTTDATTEMMIPALNAFNIPLTDVGKHTDSLTYMMKNSTLGLEDFSAAMKRMAPNIQASGMSMDEVITVLMTLESKGIKGRAALTLLQAGFTAMEKATVDGTDKTAAFNAALGITTEELSKNEVNSAKLEGTTKKYMDVANAGIGTTTALKVELEKLTLAAGTVLEPFDGLGVALAAAGPLMMALTQLPAMIGLVNAAMLFLAANPIVLVIAAIAAIVVILIILEEKFKWIEAATAILGVAWSTLWSGMTGVVSGAWSLISGTIDLMVGGIKWAVNLVIDGINSMIRGINMIHIDIPGWLGGGTLGFNIAQIPRLAAGAIVTSPTLAMVGEAGPEAIIPLSRGGGAAGGITITGNTFNVRNDNDIKLVAQELHGLITRTNQGKGSTT